MRLEFAPYLLKFKEPGGTSRGVLTEKPTFLIRVYDERQPEKFGIGEAAVFPDLSPEADGKYVWKLTELLANVAIGRETDLSRHSSIQFGLEQAIYDFSNGCKGIYFPGEFTLGEKPIEINGLVWMGDFDKMIERIDEKVEAGFKCIKLKIGAIDWESELEMIRYIRQKYSGNQLMIRVDANGAFKPEDCMSKLKSLAGLEVHSIEQPIKAGHPELMAKICKESPLPIALDEELIGKGTTDERIRTLDEIKPAYIILKPALCGGFSGAMEWISEAEKRGINWWITSALESNVGLNAIAQWTAYINASGPQGLGTGGVFTNNFETPVYLEKDLLKFDPSHSLDYSQFDNLAWKR
ncbi:MAG: o-succinylbenzoate synthase [Muribaculaceae bacterium]|nr:o-succinylbenzoate synthase [Muribaculaceae bacterium]